MPADPRLVIPRCRAVVYRRDTYRYTGGPRRFAMHYDRGRCKRAAVEGDLCRQHAKRPDRLKE